MDFETDSTLPPFVETDAQVVERGAIQEEAFAVGTKNRDKLRCEVQHLPEFDLRLSYLLPRSPWLVQIKCGYDTHSLAFLNQHASDHRLPRHRDQLLHGPDEIATIGEILEQG